MAQHLYLNDPKHKHDFHGRRRHAPRRGEGLGVGESGDVYACDARIRRQAGQGALETGPRRADSYVKLLSGI